MSYEQRAEKRRAKVRARVRAWMQRPENTARRKAAAALQRAVKAGKALRPDHCPACDRPGVVAVFDGAGEFRGWACRRCVYDQQQGGES